MPPQKASKTEKCVNVDAEDSQIDLVYSPEKVFYLNKQKYVSKSDRGNRKEKKVYCFWTMAYLQVYLEPTNLKTSTVSNKAPTNCFWQNKQWIFIVQQQALKCCLHNAILPHSTLTMNNITRKCNAIKATPYSLSPFATCVAPTLPMQYSDNIKN